VAEKKEGTPFIICKTCDTVLQHPAYLKQGTKGMKTHIESKGCALKTTVRNAGSEDIAVLLVSSSDS
jgi:hypothetical protein